MRSLTLSHPTESFDLRDVDYLVLDALRCGIPLFWNKQGIVGKLPVAVLRNAVDLYGVYKELKQRGRITDMPAASYTITWDQTEDRRPESATDQAE